VARAPWAARPGSDARRRMGRGRRLYKDKDARGAACLRRPSRPETRPEPGATRYCSGVPMLVDVSVIASAAFPKKIVPDVFVPKNRMLGSAGVAVAL